MSRTIKSLKQISLSPGQDSNPRPHKYNNARKYMVTFGVTNLQISYQLGILWTGR